MTWREIKVSYEMQYRFKSFGRSICRLASEFICIASYFFIFIQTFKYFPRVITYLDTKSIKYINRYLIEGSHFHFHQICLLLTGYIVDYWYVHLDVWNYVAWKRSHIRCFWASCNKRIDHGYEPSLEWLLAIWLGFWIGFVRL